MRWLGITGLPTCPTEGELVEVIGTISDVTAAGISKHIWDVAFGIDLKQESHGLTALRAVWIFDALDPVWIAPKLLPR